jgi:GNAT superfamily N-acetyltransferase
VIPQPLDTTARRASVADAPEVARLLHGFQTEFSEPVPELEVLAERVAQFIEREEATFLVAGSGPDGVAEVRFRPSIMTGALDAYLEELYVAPAKRGQGLGRALLEAAMETAREQGARRMGARNQRGRHRRPRAVRERRLQRPRGQARRTRDVLLRARPVRSSALEEEQSRLPALPQGSPRRRVG